MMSQLLDTKIQPIKDEIQETKKEIREIKDELQEVKADVQTVKTELQEVKADVQAVKTELQEVKDDVQGMKTELQDVKFRVMKMETLMENEIRVNIQRVAEAHLDLSRKLNECIKLSNDVKDRQEIQDIYLNMHYGKLMAM
ncbi:hypothetical protein D7X48_00030 [bacterium D16-50]|nr:hypothetical protein D7X48_00030 [bacterium D16-50]